MKTIKKLTLSVILLLSIGMLMTFADSMSASTSDLFLGVREGDKNLVQKALDAGADPKFNNSEALKMAIEKGDIEIISLLIDAGADSRLWNDYLERWKKLFRSKDI